jgi:hypothetical protein
LSYVVTMTLFFWIVVFAAVGALVLGLILKVRLMKEQQVWEDLVDRGTSTPSFDSKSDENPDAPERYDISLDSSETNEPQGEEMTTPPFSHSNRSIQEADLRRSSRIERPISLVVLGTNRRGEIFQERTSAVSLNLHGCRYSSRHEYAPEGWVTLQITGTDGANSRPVRARVRSVFSPATSRELCQVGVELETPGNVWGIPAPPDDWQRLLGTSINVASRPSVSVAPASGTAHSIAAPLDRQSAGPDRRAEVTVFPGPPAAPVPEGVAEKEVQPSKADRVVITAEQLLQALQGKLQRAADEAVQLSLSTQLDEAVKAALGKIEDGWKANIRQTEEFSTSRLADAQTMWEKELHTYRERAEDVARRIEALTALSQQALGDSQRFVERFANETAPQLQSCLNDSVARANSDFEARAAELSSRHLAEFNENTQRAANDASLQLEGRLAEARSFSATASAPVVDSVSQERIDSQLNGVRTEILDHLEKRLGDLHAGFEQQLVATGNRIRELGHQLEGLAFESSQARAQHEQGLAEVRSLLSSAEPGVPQDQISSLLKTLHEQIHNHLEWRLGEVSAHFNQLAGQADARANELSQHLEKLAVDTREQLAEARSLAERAPRGITPQDVASFEQSVQHATREFETAAARVSDRHLIRLMEQKQVVSQEASLEIEARASETRALLQKASNNTLEEFRRRVESQTCQVLAEATERVSSSLASLDAESRAAVDARRRTLEADVARAAEQSTAEFRSGIKAFLYSCLVAAVGAVDQHAQTTLAGLASDPTHMQRAIDANGELSATLEDTKYPPKAASSS